MSVAFRELERRVKRSITFEPCLPRPAKEPPSGPGWLHEIKHDGFRIVAQKDSAKARLITRNGYDFTERYPETAAMSLPRIAFRSVRAGVARPRPIRRSQATPSAPMRARAKEIARSATK
jgi:hypothetical protein